MVKDEKPVWWSRALSALSALSRFRCISQGNYPVHKPNGSLNPRRE
jgi:hypothetical protein